jgi:pimeloyl-ACP methyl ester carboxylesterase
VIEAEELDDIVLVGHSFSGIAMTGAADRVRTTRRIRRLVFFDALIPAPGRMGGAPRDPATGDLTEWFTKRIPGFLKGYKMDFLKDYPIQMLANDDEPEVQALARRNVKPHPMKGWTDQLQLVNGGWTGLPCTLIIAGAQQFAPSSEAMFGPALGNPDWTIETLPISRLGMLTQPDLVARTLLALA